MRIRVAVVVGMALLVAVTGWTQSRLGDVAGSIKLNPEAVVEKEGWVDDPSGALQTDRALLAAALEESSAAADRLTDLIVEAGSTSPNVDDALGDRISLATAELDDETRRFGQLRLASVFDESLEAAMTAADRCFASDETIRSRLDFRGTSLLVMKEAVDGCVQELGRARTVFDALGDDLAPVAEKASAGASTDEEIVAAACESELAKGFAAGEACQNRQFRALATVTSRNAENERVEPTVFAGIRRNCAELHPKDFVARDVCEVEKLTAVRVEEQ